MIRKFGTQNTIEKTNFWSYDLKQTNPAIHILILYATLTAVASVTLRCLWLTLTTFVTTNLYYQRIPTTWQPLRPSPAPSGPQCHRSLVGHIHSTARICSCVGSQWSWRYLHPVIPVRDVVQIPAGRQDDLVSGCSDRGQLFGHPTTFPYRDYSVILDLKTYGWKSYWK